jgi:hypothetical protein
VLAAVARWRDEIVTSEGALGFLRTRRPDTPDGVPNSSVSEGIAYGMIIAAMIDDQALFDAFWGYARRFLNQNGLMNWYIAPDGSRALGEGAATDADEDMAWALIMAARQWGRSSSFEQPYLEHAQGLIQSIYRFEVDHERNHMLLPGDEWPPKNVFNPSYFAPNQYRLFGEVSGNTEGWQKVVDEGYAIIDRCLTEARGNRTNGLVPAWCDNLGIDRGLLRSRPGRWRSLRLARVVISWRLPCLASYFLFWNHGVAWVIWCPSREGGGIAE